MLRTRSTWMVAVAALALPFGVTGCSNSCDDLEELCDGCPDTVKSECQSELSACRILLDGPGISESDCCDTYIPSYEDEC